MEKTIRTYTRHNFRTIPQIAVLSGRQIREIEIAARVLPFKTNSYVTGELIDWSNVESDPMFTLNFPRGAMLEKKHFHALEKLVDRQASEAEIARRVQQIRLSLNPNPAGQEQNVPSLGEIRLRGIQHKYPETVLFFPSQGQTCHACCTFCFRWPQFSGMSKLKFAMKDTGLFLKYLSLHREVTDILLTGGDPMTMHASLLGECLFPLLRPEYSHIRHIRIGTKSLAYWPYRYLTDSDSDDLMRLFAVLAAGKHLSIQAHFSHPAELSTAAVRQAIARIRNTGAQIRTQSPLLRHVNDRPELWSHMWRTQVEAGCIPYYMFVVRDTGARRFFELPLEKCWHIYRRAYRQVSGLCRTVRGPSMSHRAGKIQLLGTQQIHGESVFVLRFIQARNPEWTDIPFFARHDPKATWFSQLKPAFADRFFFEEQPARPFLAKPFQFE
ncbi:MAG: lysine 2,3-aminomutase [Tannerella sp.]|jgi:L-lysine 2,3-aminomutase|nr:lysine 2,3-aminomutase [Tannerella sp.]